MEGRTGSLWESRYKISPIDTDAYLLQCCRYVELNPVKAKMVDRPEEYPWSSYRARIGLEPCEWLNSSPVFESMGGDWRSQVEKYAAFVNQSSDARREQSFIRDAVERNQLTGSRAFVDEVERRTGIRVEHRGRGRPPAQSNRK